MEMLCQGRHCDFREQRMPTVCQKPGHDLLPSTLANPRNQVRPMDIQYITHTPTSNPSKSKQTLQSLNPTLSWSRKRWLITSSHIRLLPNPMIFSPISSGRIVKFPWFPEILPIIISIVVFFLPIYDTLSPNLPHVAPVDGGLGGGYFYGTFYSRWSRDTLLQLVYVPSFHGRYLTEWSGINLELGDGCEMLCIPDWNHNL